MSSMKRVGTCPKCRGQWYWCQSCGLAGCAKAGCEWGKFAASGLIVTTIKCPVCGSTAS